jgi:uncharacterized protein (TIGR03083 family)
MDKTLQAVDVVPGTDCDFAQLIDIWDESMTQLQDAITTADWTAATPCPGWSVGDVVAHITSLDRVMLGRADPEHTPDWSVLPHASSDFGRLTEIPVDLRRTWSRDEVLAEFEITWADRLAALRESLAQGQDTIAGPFGTPLPADRAMRMRILDTWIHEQDVRTAGNQSGNWGTSAARITAAQLVGGLPYIWGKKVSAPAGSEAQLNVVGDVSFQAQVSILPNGRGALVEATTTPEVTLNMSWPDYLQLSAGRIDPATATITMDGDEVLSRELAANLSVTP